MAEPSPTRLPGTPFEQASSVLSAAAALPSLLVVDAALILRALNSALVPAPDPANSTSIRHISQVLDREAREVMLAVAAKDVKVALIAALADEEDLVATLKASDMQSACQFIASVDSLSDLSAALKTLREQTGASPSSTLVFTSQQAALRSINRSGAVSYCVRSTSGHSVCSTSGGGDASTSGNFTPDPNRRGSIHVSSAAAASTAGASDSDNASNIPAVPAADGNSAYSGPSDGDATAASTAAAADDSHATAGGVLSVTVLEQGLAQFGARLLDARGF